jgi:hypothetical protein
MGSVPAGPFALKKSSNKVAEKVDTCS